MGARLVDARAEGFLAAVDSHRHASLFSSSPWVETVARTYGFDISASTSSANGTPGGTILFSRISDLRGDRVVCLPFADYCDPLVDDPSTWRALIEPIMALHVPVTLRCLRNDLPRSDPRFVLTKEGAWHGVDLTRSEDALWAGLAGSARQNVHKARRNGVVVRAGRSHDDLRIFYRMHCTLRKEKYRLLAQPAAFFDHLHEMFAPSERLIVLLAEVDGRPVAGVLLLQWGGTLYYKFNASTDQTFCPNDLLTWEALRLGKMQGSTRFDFGFSDLNQPGLIRYKRKYATEEQSISVLSWVPESYADRRAEQAAQVFSNVTRLLTEKSVPDEITRLAGNELYRYFC